MLKIAQIYRGKQKLKALLDYHQLNKNTLCLVRIITSNLNKEDSVKLAKEIKSILPSSKIMGATSAYSVVYNGEQVDNETLVIIEVYKRLTIKVAKFNHDNITPRQLAKEVHDSFTYNDHSSNSLVHFIISHPYRNLDKFIASINELSPSIKLIGGVAGDMIPHNLLGFVFDEDGVVENGAIAFSAYGDTSYSFTSISNSVEAISTEHIITKTKDNIIEEIDNQNSFDWMCDFLEIDSKDYNTYIEQNGRKNWENMVTQDYLTHFPLIVDYKINNARFTKYEEKDKALSFYTSCLESGTKFRMGYINPDKSIKDTYKMCEEILDVPVESMFSYSCLFRKLNLANCAKWELKPFKKHNICGMFMMGEIGHLNGENYALNGALSLSAIAESEKYIIPDIVSLEKSEVHDDKSFYEKAKEKEKLLLSHQNQKLLSKIEKFSNSSDYSLKTDPNLDVPNLYQYEEDMEKLHFDKIALIEVVTADSTIAAFGHEKYYDTIKSILGEVYQFLSKHKVDKITYFYSLNFKTFFIAGGCDVSKEDLIDYLKQIMGKYEYYTSKETGLSCIIRTYMIFEQDNLIEHGLNTMFLNKDSQETFIISDGKTNISQKIYNEADIISVISKALANKKIIPFYQGIYNNRLNCITKYEALMRLEDENGKIHPPAYFMDVAKKYKLYQKLSKMMITKVLKDFRRKKESVSINLSLLDIQSDDFRKWILEKLKNHPRPEKVVIEFIETEDYIDSDVLFQFISELRKIKCKIAIDDFGTGYATLSTIVKISPDYIKIDGSIIKYIVTDNNSKILLNTVSYLSKQMNTKTIAEFVENNKIQGELEDKKIDYSQGYYFSKPAPFNEL